MAKLEEMGQLSEQHSDAPKALRAAVFTSKRIMEECLQNGEDFEATILRHTMSDNQITVKNAEPLLALGPEIGNAVVKVLMKEALKDPDCDFVFLAVEAVAANAMGQRLECLLIQAITKEREYTFMIEIDRENKTCGTPLQPVNAKIVPVEKDKLDEKLAELVGVPPGATLQ